LALDPVCAPWSISIALVSQEEASTMLNAPMSLMKSRVSAVVSEGVISRLVLSRRR